MTNFKDLGLCAPLVDALEAEGIADPFPIQALTLPVALSGHDIIGQAKTGTGKTFGFGLPLIQRLGDVPEADMRRTFNLGIGLVAVVPEHAAAEAQAAWEALGERPVLIGRVRG